MAAMGAEDTTLVDLDRRLAWARADLEQHRRFTAQLESSRRQLAVLHARITRLEQRVARERRDVDDLEGANLAALLAWVTGEYAQRAEKELDEWLVARLRLDQTRQEHAALAAQVDALARRLASLADPLPAYHALLGLKSHWIAEHGAERVEARLHVAERRGVLTDFSREIDEALWAGQVAKAALTGLINALSKAQALGKLDMIGLASNWVKFEHIDDAHRHASAANRALSRFQMELADVRQRHEAFLSLELGQLATFADYFLDDMVSDWIVQCRIDRSHASAGIARTRVNRTLTALIRQQQDVRNELRTVEERAAKLAGEG